MNHKLAAEFIGTAWLVLGGCGAAVLDAAFPQLGIGFVGVAFAFAALFAGGWALEQLWLFWVATIAGALIAGFVYRWLSPDVPAQVDVSGR